jgi:hypothetical protein
MWDATPFLFSAWIWRKSIFYCITQSLICCLNCWNVVWNLRFLRWWRCRYWCSGIWFNVDLHVDNQRFRGSFCLHLQGWSCYLLTCPHGVIVQNCNLDTLKCRLWYDSKWKYRIYLITPSRSIYWLLQKMANLNLRKWVQITFLLSLQNQ